MSDDAVTSDSGDTRPDLDRRIAHRTDGTGHWLAFGDERIIVGCICGFKANTEDDAGYGDSVIDHIEEVVREEGRDAARAALAEAERRIARADSLHCECTTVACACGGGPGWCHGCDESWPCSTASALAVPPQPEEER